MEQQGAPTPDSAAQNAPATPPPPPEWKDMPKSDRRIAVGCLTMMLVALIGLVVFFVRFCNRPEIRPITPPSAQVENNAYDGSVYQVEKYLKAHLKDPDSYEGIRWGEVTRVDMPRWKYFVWHEYRARNSFGGMVVEKKRFYLDANGNVVDVK